MADDGSTLLKLGKTTLAPVWQIAESGLSADPGADWMKPSRIDTKRWPHTEIIHADADQSHVAGTSGMRRWRAGLIPARMCLSV